MKYIRTQNGNLIAIPTVKPINSDLARLLENQKNSVSTVKKDKTKIY